MAAEREPKRAKKARSVDGKATPVAIPIPTPSSNARPSIHGRPSFHAWPGTPGTASTSTPSNAAPTGSAWETPERQAAIISYHTLDGGKTFERVFDPNTNLSSIQDLVRRKLKVASDLPVSLSYRVGNNDADLEDDDDFAAFRLRAITARVMRVFVSVQGAPSKLKESHPLSTPVNRPIYASPSSAKAVHGTPESVAQQRKRKPNQKSKLDATTRANERSDERRKDEPRGNMRKRKAEGLGEDHDRGKPESQAAANANSVSSPSTRLDNEGSISKGGPAKKRKLDAGVSPGSNGRQSNDVDEDGEDIERKKKSKRRRMEGRRVRRLRDESRQGAVPALLQSFSGTQPSDSPGASTPAPTPAQSTPAPAPVQSTPAPAPAQSQSPFVGASANGTSPTFQFTFRTEVPPTASANEIRGQTSSAQPSPSQVKPGRKKRKRLTDASNGNVPNVAADGAVTEDSGINDRTQPSASQQLSPRQPGLESRPDDVVSHVDELTAPARKGSMPIDAQPSHEVEQTTLTAGTIAGAAAGKGKDAGNHEASFGDEDDESDEESSDDDEEEDEEERVSDDELDIAQGSDNETTDSSEDEQEPQKEDGQGNEDRSSPNKAPLADGFASLATVDEEGEAVDLSTQDDGAVRLAMDLDDNFFQNGSVHDERHHDEQAVVPDTTSAAEKPREDDSPARLQMTPSPQVPSANSDAHPSPEVNHQAIGSGFAVDSAYTAEPSPEPVITPPITRSSKLRQAMKDRQGQVHDDKVIASQPTPVPPTPVPKRPRGRPRKKALEEPASVSLPAETTEQAAGPPQPRKPGRPRKTDAEKAETRARWQAAQAAKKLQEARARKGSLLSSQREIEDQADGADDSADVAAKVASSGEANVDSESQPVGHVPEPSPGSVRVSPESLPPPSAAAVQSSPTRQQGASPFVEGVISPSKSTKGLSSQQNGRPSTTSLSTTNSSGEPPSAQPVRKSLTSSVVVTEKELKDHEVSNDLSANSSPSQAAQDKEVPQPALVSAERHDDLESSSASSSSDTDSEEEDDAEENAKGDANSGPVNGRVRPRRETSSGRPTPTILHSLKGRANAPRHESGSLNNLPSLSQLGNFNMRGISPALGSPSAVESMLGGVNGDGTRGQSGLQTPSSISSKADGQSSSSEESSSDSESDSKSDTSSDSEPSSSDEKAKQSHIPASKRAGAIVGKEKKKTKGSGFFAAFS